MQGMVRIFTAGIRAVSNVNGDAYSKMQLVNETVCPEHISQNGHISGAKVLQFLLPINLPTVSVILVHIVTRKAPFDP